MKLLVMQIINAIFFSYTHTHTHTYTHTRVRTLHNNKTRVYITDIFKGHYVSHLFQNSRYESSNLNQYYWVCGLCPLSLFYTQQKLDLFIQQLRIAVSVKPDSVGASALLLEDGNRSAGFRSSGSDIIYRVFHDFRA